MEDDNIIGISPGNLPFSLDEKIFFPTCKDIGHPYSYFGLFIWNRTESRADMRHMDIKLESTRDLVRAIYEEMKDFDNRLCRIEEKNKEK